MGGEIGSLTGWDFYEGNKSKFLRQGALLLSTLAFGLVAGNSLDDPFLLGPEHTASIPSQKIPMNTDSSDHSTRFHCVMVHPRCLRAREVDGASGHC